MDRPGTAVQVCADLSRLQEQLHELHQRMLSAANEEEDSDRSGYETAMVIRGR